MTVRWAALAVALLLLLASFAGAAEKRRATRYRFEATAYSIEGITKSGLDTRHGLIAADPKVLPLGTQVSVTSAGPYSGRYLVADTGREIQGREIDIYLANDVAAKKFGRKKIRLRVIKWGTGEVTQASR